LVVRRAVGLLVFETDGAALEAFASFAVASPFVSAVLPAAVDRRARVGRAGDSGAFAVALDAVRFGVERLGGVSGTTGRSDSALAARRLDGFASADAALRRALV